MLVPKTKRPIVMIIGSCKFLDKMKEIGWEYTRAGWIVMLPNERPENAADVDSIILENIGKSKIDLADEVIVCDVNGYIGESTTKELEYAKSKDKKIRYLV